MNKFFFLVIYLILVPGFSQAEKLDGQDSLSVIMKINNYYEVKMEIFDFEEETSEIKLSSRMFFLSVNELLEKSLIEKLKSKIDSKQRLRLEDIKKEGLDIKYDPQNVQINLIIDPNKRKIQNLNFGINSLNNKDLIRPNFFSHYSNFRVSKTMDTQSLSTTRSLDEDFPVSVQIENVENINGFVLSSELNYQEFSTFPWTRGLVSLTKDSEEYGSRWVLGDSNVGFDGFQSSAQIAGLSYSKVFSIQPNKSITPTFRNSFFLERNSEVDILINGRVYRTVQLQAGHHQISNLPIERGLNDVVLKIRDDLGRVRELLFPFISGFELLDQGIHDFSYGYGYRRSFLENKPIYDRESGIGSFYHRIGFTKWLTGGINLQGDKNLILGGISTSLGTPLGIFLFDIAQSQIEGLGKGWGERVRYRSLLGSSLIFRFEYESVDPNFSSLGTNSPNNIYPKSFDLDLSLSIGRGYSFGAGWRYERGLPSAGDRRTSFANFSKFWGRSLVISSQFTRLLDPQLGKDSRFLITLQWTDSKNNNQVIANHDTLADSKSIEWTNNPAREVEKPVVSAYVENGEDREQYRINLGYIGHRGTILLDQVSQFSENSILQPETHRTRLTAQTAFVLTNGGFGFTRPISDSFIMIDAEGALSDQNIEINPTSSQNLALADSFGPGLLPAVTSYFPFQVLLQTKDPLASPLLKNNSFRIFPTYKSGTTVSISGEKSVILMGRLKEQSGKVIPLITGLITSKNQESKIEFFTNREGEFYLPSIAPGTYVITIDNSNLKGLLVVPDKSFGEVNLGDLHLSTSSLEYVPSNNGALKNKIDSQRGRKLVPRKKVRRRAIKKRRRR